VAGYTLKKTPIFESRTDKTVEGFQPEAWSNHLGGSFREATISISGVSSNSGLPQTDSQSSVSQLRQTFKQLASSLQSGDLSGAQKAFASLETLLQSNQSASQGSTGQSASTQKSPVQSDLAALGQALSSGDLSAAQGDFSKLQKDLQPAGQSGGSSQSVGSAHRHGHHHHTEASDSDSTATTTDTTPSTTSANSPNSTGGTISLYA
jgi:hypothetical protein